MRAVRRGAAAAWVLVVVGVVVGVVLGVAAAPAGAHAVLESSDPADGAVLSEAPGEVSFTFNEGVRVSTGGLRVVDQDGERVDTGETSSSGTTATVELEADLPEGIYTAAYRIISADGHPVRGGIVFQVGEDVDAPAVSLDDVLGTSDRGWEVSAAVLRAVAYLGALLAAGGAAFLVLVHDGGPGRDRLVRLVVVGAVVGAVALLLTLPVQAALATGLGPDALLEDGVLSDVLADGVGLSILVTVLALADLVVALRLLPDGSAAQRAVVLVGAVVAAGGFALTGHTLADEAPWWMLPVDAAHAVAAAAWFGGLVLLALTLRRRNADGDPVASATVLDRFSRLATAAVVVAGLAGFALAYSEVRALRALDSTYGAVLVAKLAVLAPVGLVACWNHWTLLPRVEQDEDAGLRERALRRVRGAVTAEAVGLVLVLVITAVLVNVTPARTTAGITGIYSDTQQIGEWDLNLVVDPNQAGQNEVHLYFFDESGAPLVEDTFDSVLLQMTPPGAELGAIEREPTYITPGHYTLTGNELSIPGQWGIEAEVRYDEFGLSTAEFPVRVNP